MTKSHWFGVLMTALALTVVAGCTGRQNESAGGEKSTKDGEDHDHGPMPHGGTLIEFGKWHAEFTVDRKAQEATVYIFSHNNKPRSIAAEKLLLSIKSPSFQVDLKAAPQEGDKAGKASRFVGKHENLGKEPEFEGTLSGVVDGTPYAGDFKEEEHKDHKHEKK
jgi:hypothetical protein